MRTVAQPTDPEYSRACCRVGVLVYWRAADLERHHGGSPEEEGRYEQQERCQMVYCCLVLVCTKHDLFAPWHARNSQPCRKLSSIVLRLLAAPLAPHAQPSGAFGNCCGNRQKCACMGSLLTGVKRRYLQASGLSQESSALGLDRHSHHRCMRRPCQC